MYAEYLTACGYKVALATNGQEALDVAFVAPPDLIVMDLSLPVLDGWEATRRLKADARTQHIPIVALTGHALAGHSQGAKEAGCDGFLAKPCLPQTLAEVVRQMLDAKDGKDAKKNGGRRKGRPAASEALATKSSKHREGLR
jgi:CheY-like chemotaxis protein